MADYRAPTDAAAFVNSTGAWANTTDGKSTTGLDDVDLWVGGLAESQNLFGGLLGSTFNYVFEQQLTDLGYAPGPADGGAGPRLSHHLCDAIRNLWTAGEWVLT